MKAKRRTSNPDVDEQELINQVHMRTMSGAMGLMEPPSPAAETADGQDERDMEITTESLPAEQRTKATTVGRPSLPEKSRTAQTPRDYDSIFLVPNVLDARKATYIGAEVHNASWLCATSAALPSGLLPAWPSSVSCCRCEKRIGCRNR